MYAGPPRYSDNEDINDDFNTDPRYNSDRCLQCLRSTVLFLIYIWILAVGCCGLFSTLNLEFVVFNGFNGVNGTTNAKDGDERNPAIKDESESTPNIFSNPEATIWDDLHTFLTYLSYHLLGAVFSLCGWYGAKKYRTFPLCLFWFGSCMSALLLFPLVFILFGMTVEPSVEIKKSSGNKSNLSPFSAAANWLEQCSPAAQCCYIKMQRTNSKDSKDYHSNSDSGYEWQNICNESGLPNGFRTLAYESVTDDAESDSDADINYPSYYLDCLFGAHPAYNHVYPDISDIELDSNHSTLDKGKSVYINHLQPGLPCLPAVGIFARCADFGNTPPPGMTKLDYYQWNEEDSTPVIGITNSMSSSKYNQISHSLRKPMCSLCDSLKIVDKSDGLDSDSNLDFDGDSDGGIENEMKILARKLEREEDLDDDEQEEKVILGEQNLLAKKEFVKSSMETPMIKQNQHQVTEIDLPGWSIWTSNSNSPSSESSESSPSYYDSILASFPSASESDQTNTLTLGGFLFSPAKIIKILRKYWLLILESNLSQLLFPSNFITNLVYTFSNSDSLPETKIWNTVSGMKKLRIDQSRTNLESSLLTKFNLVDTSDSSKPTTATNPSTVNLNYDVTYNNLNQPKSQDVTPLDEKHFGELWWNHLLDTKFQQCSLRPVEISVVTLFGSGIVRQISIFLEWIALQGFIFLVISILSMIFGCAMWIKIPPRLMRNEDYVRLQ